MLRLTFGRSIERLVGEDGFEDVGNRVEGDGGSGTVTWTGSQAWPPAGNQQELGHNPN